MEFACLFLEILVMSWKLEISEIAERFWNSVGRPGIGQKRVFWEVYVGVLSREGNYVISVCWSVG